MSEESDDNNSAWSAFQPHQTPKLISRNFSVGRASCQKVDLMERPEEIQAGIQMDQALQDRLSEVVPHQSAVYGSMMGPEKSRDRSMRTSSLLCSTSLHSMSGQGGLFGSASQVTPPAGSAPPPQVLFGSASQVATAASSAPPPQVLICSAYKVTPPASSAPPPQALFGSASQVIPPAGSAPPPQVLFGSASQVATAASSAPPPQVLICSAYKVIPPAGSAPPPQALFGSASQVIPPAGSAPPPQVLFGSASQVEPPAGSALKASSWFEPSFCLSARRQGAPARVTQSVMACPMPGASLPAGQAVFGTRPSLVPQAKAAAAAPLSPASRPVGAPRILRRAVHQEATLKSAGGARSPDSEPKGSAEVLSVSSVSRSIAKQIKECRVSDLLAFGTSLAPSRRLKDSFPSPPPPPPVYSGAPPPPPSSVQWSSTIAPGTWASISSADLSVPVIGSQHGSGAVLKKLRQSRFSRSRGPDPEEQKLKWTKIFQLQQADGYWELTVELGKLINLNVDAFANVFLKNKGIHSLGVKVHAGILRLVATLLVLQLMREEKLEEGKLLQSLFDLKEAPEPRSERWEQVKKAVDWVRWADREYPCACSRLEFGWSWESSTRQLLGFERFPPFSPLISLELQQTAVPLVVL